MIVLGMKDKFNKHLPNYIESNVVVLDEVFPSFEILQVLCAKSNWSRSYAKQMKIEGTQMLDIELSYCLIETHRVKCFYKQMKDSDKLDAVIRTNFEGLRYGK